MFMHGRRQFIRHLNILDKPNPQLPHHGITSNECILQWRNGHPRPYCFSCSALWASEVVTVLAGGLSVITNCMLGKSHSSSKTGQCKVWDKNADGYYCADGNGSHVINSSKSPFTTRRWIRCSSLSRKSPSMFHSNTPFKYSVFPSSPFLMTSFSTGRPSMHNTYDTLLGSREPHRRSRGWPRRRCIRREDNMARRRGRYKQLDKFLAHRTLFFNVSND